MVQVMTGRSAVGSGRRRGLRSWIVLGLSAIMLAIGLTPVLSHGLVRLSNSRQGQPLLPGTIAPGGFVSGQVVLTNRGWLPIAINLQPRNPDGALPARLSLKVQDLQDGGFLYAGPLRPSMGPLIVLEPGQSVSLLVTLISEDTEGTAAIPVPLTYAWDAGPALPWWWWVPVVLSLGALVYYGFHRRRNG